MFKRMLSSCPKKQRRKKKGSAGAADRNYVENERVPMIYKNQNEESAVDLSLPNRSPREKVHSFV